MGRPVHLKTKLESCTKDCSVILKRLDEKLLKQYLRCDVKTVDSHQNAVNRRTINKKSEEIRNRSNSRWSSVTSVRKRKKRIKPLCYTDDEDSADCSPLQVTPGNDRVSGGEECTLSSKELTTMSKIEELKVESSHDSSCIVVGTEKVKEFPSSVRENVNCDETKRVRDGTFITYGEPVKSQESDDESREDGEDDRSTVTFDKVADLEEVRGDKESSQKLKKKKITNRKRQRLIKFKRKSMAGINMGKIRKNKSKPAGNPTGRDAAEKNSNEVDAEDCLKKVCVLVRRLHDMYTIILQLQKEMPGDTELSIHFKRVINAQQENFHTEIRKTRKTIIKCFERMMKAYKTLNRVASEVGKRIFLSVDEVIHILSLCILSDGSCDVDRAEQPKSSPNNPCTVKNQRTESIPSKTNAPPQEVVIPEGSNSSSPLGPCVPSPVVSLRPESIQRPAPVVMEASKAWLPPCSNHLQPSSPFGNTQINVSGTSRPPETNLFRQLNPNPPVVRQPVPMTHVPNTRSQYCNVPYSNPNWCLPPRPRPISGCPSYPMVGHYPQVPLRREGTSTLRLNSPAQRPFGCVLDKPTPYQMRMPNPVRCPIPNTPRYSAIPNRILGVNENSHALNEAPTHTGGVVPSLGSLHYGFVNGHIIPTAQSESQNRPAFPDPAGYSPPVEDKSVRQRLPVPEKVRHPSTETIPAGRNDNTRIQTPQVLDPTIPQKLTMKDCRLQAGPVLGSGERQLKERTTATSEKVDQETSKARVYICARSNCKKPGVRICKFCESVIYCSETCQVKHWEQKHKVVCCQLRELRG